jgi:hypothetical protein
MSVFNQELLYDEYQKKVCEQKKSIENDYRHLQDRQMMNQFDICSDGGNKTQNRQLENAREFCLERTNTKTKNQIETSRRCHGWECSTQPFLIKPDRSTNSFMNFPTYRDGYICTNNHRVFNNMTGRKRATCNDIQK